MLKGKSIVSGRMSKILIYALSLFFMWYLNFYRLGLYGEDLYRVTRCMNFSIRDFFPFLINLFTHIGGAVDNYPVEGRPLHEFFISFFSWIGFKFNIGVKGIYIIGFFIVLTNSLLVSRLAMHISGDKAISFLSGLLYIILPADTTKLWITSALGIQSAITFLLLALLLYDRVRFISFPLAFISLFIYEAQFPVFIIAPLISRKGRPKIEQIVIHILGVCFLFLIYFYIRTRSGESRIGSLQIMSVISTIISQIFYGFSISSILIPYRMMTSLFFLNIERILILIFFSTLFYYIMTLFYKRDERNEDSNSSLSIRNICLDKRLWISLLIIILSYVFFMYPSAKTVGGRFSRVHSIASIGVAIFYSIILWRYLKTFGHLLFLRILMAISLSLLICFGILVQQDFVKDWSNEQSFWTEFANLTDDLDDNDLVIIDGEAIDNITDNKFVGGIGCTKLDTVYKQFLLDDKENINIFILHDGWREKLSFIDNENIVYEPYFSKNTSDIIYLKRVNSRLVRVHDTKEFHGRYVIFKEKDGNGNGANKYGGYLYNILHIDSINDTYLIEGDSDGYFIHLSDLGHFGSD